MNQRLCLMKINFNKKNLVLFILLELVFSTYAQVDSSFKLKNPVNIAHLWGIGQNTTYDNYLSENVYSGLSLNYLYERQKRSDKNRALSSQKMAKLWLVSESDLSKKGSFLSFYTSYRWGLFYEKQLTSSFSLRTGGLLGGYLGGIYNSRNSNNPVQIKSNLGLSFSTMLLYQFKLKSQPFYLRYQLNNSLLGVTFSPNYKQSYYEIFHLENHQKTILFSSFHNLLEFENFLTLDIPLPCLIVRLGYSGFFVKSHLNNLKTQLTNHSFMIGIVKEGFFIKKKKDHLLLRERSAIY